MREIGRDSPSQMKKNRRGVFVRGHRLSKGDVTQVLQRIGKSVVRRIAAFPQPVPLGELLGRESCQPEEIVRPILDHVDSEVVPGIDVKIRPICVAKSESLEFE